MRQRAVVAGVICVAKRAGCGRGGGARLFRGGTKTAVEQFYLQVCFSAPVGGERARGHTDGRTTHFSGVHYV